MNKNDCRLFSVEQIIELWISTPGSRLFSISALGRQMIQYVDEKFELAYQRIIDRMNAGELTAEQLEHIKPLSSGKRSHYVGTGLIQDEFEKMKDDLFSDWIDRNCEEITEEQP